MNRVGNFCSYTSSRSSKDVILFLRKGNSSVRFLHLPHLHPLDCWAERSSSTQGASPLPLIASLEHRSGLSSISPDSKWNWEREIVWERKHELWLAREGNLKSEFGANLGLKYPLLGQLLLYFGPLPLLVHTSPEKQIPGSIREGWPIFKEATTISPSQFFFALEVFSVWSFAIQAWPCCIHYQAYIDVDVGMPQGPGSSEDKWGRRLCGVKERTQAEVRRPGFQSGLLLQSCEILNLSLYLSELQIFHLWNGEGIIFGGPWGRSKLLQLT